MHYDLEKVVQHLAVFSHAKLERTLSSYAKVHCAASSQNLLLSKKNNPENLLSRDRGSYLHEKFCMLPGISPVLEVSLWLQALDLLLSLYGSRGIGVIVKMKSAFSLLSPSATSEE